MKAIRLAGPIDPLRALEVNDDIVLSFLAMHKLSGTIASMRGFRYIEVENAC